MKITLDLDLATARAIGRVLEGDHLGRGYKAADGDLRDDFLRRALIQVLGRVPSLHTEDRRRRRLRKN
jgi:hypothetical protein